MELHIIFAKLSWLLLIYILLLRPLAEIFRWKPFLVLMRYRKEAGILCGSFAVLHALLFLWEASLPISTIWNLEFWTFDNLWGWGIVALIAMLFPLVTSNKLSQKTLKSKWKTIQQITYLAFIFTGIHIYFAKESFTAGILPIIIWAFFWSWAHIRRRRQTIEN